MTKQTTYEFEGVTITLNRHTMSDGYKIDVPVVDLLDTFTVTQLRKLAMADAPLMRWDYADSLCDYGELINVLETGDTIVFDVAEGEQPEPPKFRYVTYTATSTEYLQATLKVPAHITDDQIEDWYKNNGCTGEFEQNGGNWDWGDINECEPTDAATQLEIEE